VAARVLGRNIISTPENTDGLRRSPRISSILDGHKAKIHSSSASRLRGSSFLANPQLQGAPEGNSFDLCSGPVKLPSLLNSPL
jgi:hypothetical protein